MSGNVTICILCSSLREKFSDLLERLLVEVIPFHDLQFIMEQFADGRVRVHADSPRWTGAIFDFHQRDNVVKLFAAIDSEDRAFVIDTAREAHQAECAGRKRGFYTWLNVDGTIGEGFQFARATGT